MNAHAFLSQQHRDHQNAYARYRVAEGDARHDIADEILKDLTVHSAIEEELYYPELEKAGEKDLSAEYKAEHDEAKTLIVKLSIMDKDSEEFDPTMKALMEAIDQHIGEEESEGFPKAEELISEVKLEALGEALEKRAKELDDSAIRRLWASMSI